MTGELLLIAVLSNAVVCGTCVGYDPKFCAGTSWGWGVSAAAISRSSLSTLVELASSKPGARSVSPSNRFLLSRRCLWLYFLGMASSFLFLPLEECLSFCLSAERSTCFISKRKTLACAAFPTEVEETFSGEGDPGTVLEAPSPLLEVGAPSGVCLLPI